MTTDKILTPFRSFYSKDIGKVRRDTLHKTNRMIGEEQQGGGFTALTVSPFNYIMLTQLAYQVVQESGN